MRFFSCQDFGWSCIKRQPEYEVQVDQGDQLYYTGTNKELFTTKPKHDIERTTCFVIVNQHKKIDRIKRITVKRTNYLQISNPHKKKITKCSMHHNFINDGKDNDSFLKNMI